MSALFAGSSIAFNVKGSPTRQAGRFISIDRDSTYTDNDYDDKILGQYLATSVTHTINSAGYTSSVLAVKPYLFKNQSFNEDIQ
jgi:hypothetical protein